MHFPSYATRGVAGVNKYTIKLKIIHLLPGSIFDDFEQYGYSSFTYNVSSVKLFADTSTSFSIYSDFSCAAQQLNASQSTHRFSFVNHTIKTVNMPKVRHSVNLKSKLTSYISENKEDGLSTDNKILFCNLCQCAVSSTQKFLVQQHITTSKHQANKQLNSKQRQLFLTQPTTSNVRSEFNIDLCRSLISADIPLYKLKNKVFREFLEKYTQHTIPDESTLRKTYAPSIYDETIQKIRDEIKDSSIWVSIDETPDKEGRLVGNVVIGLLSEQYSERILLHCDVLEKCNNKTIVKLFNEAMDFSCAAQQLNASQSTHRFSFVNHTIKTVNMPKVRHSVNLKSKLTSYISEFKEDGLSTDNKILFCNLCQCAVSSTQKFLVQQHITTSKHQANKQLNSKQRQLFLTQPTTSNVRSEFNIDLCRSLISADIPLYKLKNKVFREFLEKYTQHTIPDESTLRKTYAPSIYDETIQKIRDEIKDSSIWVSIDETPDKEGRLVGNVVIGLLSEQYSERILLHCDVLEKCNNKTIVKLFNEAMGILWPKGIMYDNVLFFISDAALIWSKLDKHYLLYILN
ncbi:hypothetical protein ANN_02948 [Periplaneta americana]|uniref:Uncharacterized protein n=1 Tax=Periplaneta americana TaxID=6978 RepID=A0ABQ8U2D6_PERAM|nr:hypothetical protein ANN_02948 [Periplaneta americana]